MFNFETAISVEDKGIRTDLAFYEVVSKIAWRIVYSLAERNGRYVLIIKPKTWEEYYTPEELAEMRQPEFVDEVETIVKRAQQS